MRIRDDADTGAADFNVSAHTFILAQNEVVD